MSIEADDDGGDLAIPQPDAAVLVADGIYVGVGLTLGDGGDLGLAVLVLPAVEELALLDIPG